MIWLDTPVDRIAFEDAPMDANASKLRELACWYREFAERAGNPVIWEARLRTAQHLETEADHIDRSIRSETSIRDFVRS